MDVGRATRATRATRIRQKLSYRYEFKAKVFKRSLCTNRLQKKRREKGRRAQAAFRQRQIDSIQQLRDKNAILSTIAANVITAASQGSQHLQSAIEDAARMLSCDRMKAASSPSFRIPTLQEPVDSSATGWPLWYQDGLCPFPAQPSSLLLHNEGDVESTWPVEANANCQLHTFNPEGIPKSLSRVSPSEESSLTAIENSGYDGLGYIERLPLFPPPDIVPYLGVAAYTFAGQLYWESLAFADAAIRAVNCEDPAPKAVAAVEAHFRRSLCLLPISDMLSLLQTRLSFRKAISDEMHHQYLGKARTAVPASSPSSLAQKITGFHPHSDYFDAFDVEMEFRRSLGLDILVFEATLREGIPDKHISLVHHMLNMMTQKSVCWGDGPRWESTAVSRFITLCKASQSSSIVTVSKS